MTDPVAEGFVTNLAHPGGNLTGFTMGLGDFPDKRLELFKALIPQLRRVLILIDPEDPVTPGLLAEVRRAGAGLKLQLVERQATTQADIEQVFDAAIADEMGGVFVVSPNLQVKFSSLLIRLAAERRLPVPRVCG
jgi:putative ABC transport system substrate-binding protein